MITDKKYLVVQEFYHGDKLLLTQKGLMTLDVAKDHKQQLRNYYESSPLFKSTGFPKFHVVKISCVEE